MHQEGAPFTGSSRGIGREEAGRLATEWFWVTRNYTGNVSKAEEVVADIKKAIGGAAAAARKTHLSNCIPCEKNLKHGGKRRILVYYLLFFILPVTLAIEFILWMLGFIRN